MAVQQRVHKGVSDPEQAWILGELIRYLEHPKSGALDFSDMGESWTAVRDSVMHGTLRSSDKGLLDVVIRWEQLLQFAALRMGRELGADVQVVLSRKELADPALRLASQTAEAVERSRLTGSLRIPQSVSDIAITADLRGGRLHVSVDLDAPTEGRQGTRVAWLLRQLKDSPEQLRLDSWSMNSRTSMSELLSTVRLNPEKLIEDQKKNLRSFRITATSTLGPKRGSGRGGFIDSVLSSFAGFYETVVQDLRPWVPKAPQLPSGGRSAAEAAGIDTTPPASDLEDTTEWTEAEDPDDDTAELSDDADTSTSRWETESTTDQEDNSSYASDAPGEDPGSNGSLLTWDSLSDRDIHAAEGE